MLKIPVKNCPSAVFKLLQMINIFKLLFVFQMDDHRLASQDRETDGTSGASVRGGRGKIQQTTDVRYGQL